MNLPNFALRRGALLSVTLLLGIMLVACSGGGSTASGGNAGGGTIAVTDGVAELSAVDLEFDASTISAPAGEAFAISFTNNDSVPHNVSVYTAEGGDGLAEGTVINAGETAEVEVPALDAGEYYFVCDLHPDMNGAVVVEA